VEKSALPKVAEGAFTTMGFAVQNNPAPASEQTALMLLEKSYQTQ